MKDFLIFFCALIVLGAHAMPEKRPVEYVNPMFYGKWELSRSRDGITGNIKITPGHISQGLYEEYEICEDPIVNTDKTIIMECEVFTYTPINGRSLLPTQPKPYNKYIVRLDLKPYKGVDGVSYTLYYYDCNSLPYIQKEALRHALYEKSTRCGKMIFYKKDVGDPKNPTIRLKRQK